MLHKMPMPRQEVDETKYMVTLIGIISPGVDGTKSMHIIAATPITVQLANQECDQNEMVFDLHRIMWMTNTIGRK